MSKHPNIYIYIFYRNKSRNKIKNKNNKLKQIYQKLLTFLRKSYRLDQTPAKDVAIRNSNVNMKQIELYLTTRKQ